MSFRVKARTLLHLGAELITGDDIALYELIKNAFDARSRRVLVRVTVTLAFSQWQALRALLQQRVPEDLLHYKNEIIQSIEPAAPLEDRRILEHAVNQADDLPAVRQALDEAYTQTNRIEVEDEGDGMSLSDLSEVYLTIGTRSRRTKKDEQRKNPSARSKESKAFLGDKGIGRLSAMRLADKLEVLTTRAGDPLWHCLSIDWGRFSHDSEEYLEEIFVAPENGGEKPNANEKGTRIRMLGLKSDWTKDTLRDIAKKEFSRLFDPFSSERGFPVRMIFNHERVPIPPMDKVVLNSAHAHGEARFEIGKDGPAVRACFNYKLRHKEKRLALLLPELTGIIDPISPETLMKLGPFTMEFYWHNRRIVKAIPEEMDRKELLDKIKNWGGGIMLFRDGFRIPSYGTGNDDWLRLDPEAFKSKAYRVNRAQIIGRANITSAENPRLIDRANREGLVDTPEKTVFIALLRHIFITEFKRFVEKVEQEARDDEVKTADLDEIEQRLSKKRELTRKDVTSLKSRLTEPTDKKIMDHVLDMFVELDGYLKQARGVITIFENDHSKYLHLAGLGLMVEIVAHELNRAAAHALQTVHTADPSAPKEKWQATLRMLEYQLKTLEKRLRVLDPMGTAARQRKTQIDLANLAGDSIEYHEGQFKRHSINARLEIHGGKSLKLKAVPGMILQIIENMLANSVYWLKQQHKLEPYLQAEILFEIDAAAKQLRITDNGPGVAPERAEEIFQEFVTTKPPGEGKGLGLYISREIAHYHQAEVYMLNESTIHEGRYNTFVFALEGLQP